MGNHWGSYIHDVTAPVACCDYVGWSCAACSSCFCCTERSAQCWRVQLRVRAMRHLPLGVLIARPSGNGVRKCVLQLRLLRASHHFRAYGQPMTFLKVGYAAEIHLARVSSWGLNPPTRRTTSSRIIFYRTVPPQVSMPKQLMWRTKEVPTKVGQTTTRASGAIAAAHEEASRSGTPWIMGRRTLEAGCIRLYGCW